MRVKEVQRRGRPEGARAFLTQRLLCISISFDLNHARRVPLFPTVYEPSSNLSRVTQVLDGRSRAHTQQPDALSTTLPLGSLMRSTGHPYLAAKAQTC